MAAITGYFCKLYRNTGTYGSPTWVEVLPTRDVKSNCVMNEIDASVRGGNGWQQNVPGLKNLTLEFNLLWDSTDASLTAISDAYFANPPTTIEFLALSGPIGTAGNKGIRAVCYVTNFSRNEGLEEAVTVDVTAKPAAGVNAPSVFTST